MKLLLFFLILFFICLIGYQIFMDQTVIEGLETDISDNDIRISNLEKEFEDLSGNVASLQTQVDGLVQAQQQYASQNAPTPPNISLESVS